MSEDYKRDLDTELAQTKTKLNERRKNKEGRRANGQGRFERRSDQGQSGLPERDPSMTGGVSWQVPLNPKADTARSFGPPSPHFDPNDPEFLQFLEFKRQMKSPTAPNQLAESYQLANEVSSPCDLDPRSGISIISNHGEMANPSLPPLQSNFATH